jgi:chromate transporter
LNAPHGVSFREALWVWVRVATLSFGGPAGQIAVMHRILVDEKRWVSESRFLHALNYCMLLPGPEAQQLATYVGWLLHRTAGGLAAGVLFVLPGFAAILALSILYARHQESAVVVGLFLGLKAAVLAVVVEAMLRIGRRALANRVTVGLAALAFVAIFFLEVPFPAIVLGAALIGLAGERALPEAFAVASGYGPGAAGEARIADAAAAHARPTLGRSVRVAAVWLVLWAAPLAALALWLGPAHVLVTEGVFFSKAAVVTFGGAYAVLAYIAQQAVEHHGWLLPGEMLDGLGMAESTPGPLIQVVQFVGFMGAYRHPGPLDPLPAAILGSLVTTWVTFVPCFLWIFLGAPYIERLRGNRQLGAALSAITAAVVGVMLSLAVWFALHVAFGAVGEARAFGVRLLVPDLATADLASILIAAGASVAILRFGWGMLATLGASAAAGLVYRLGLGAWIAAA